DRSRYVDIAHTIAVSEAERLLVTDIVRHAQQAPTGHGIITRIDERHGPWLGTLAVHLHAIVLHVEGDIGHVQEIVGEILLDHVSLVAAADHEFVDAVVGVHLQDVPQDRLAAYLDHGFRAQRSFFAESGAKTSSQDHGLHVRDSPEATNASE